MPSLHVSIRLANVLDEPAARGLLALLALPATWLLGPAAIAFAAIAFVDPQPLPVFLGFGGVLGLLGWWARVLLPASLIFRHVALHYLVLAALLLGTAAAGFGAWALDGPWRLLFLPATIAGAIMSAGTIRAPARQPREQHT
jgi:hypothetical protein